MRRLFFTLLVITVLGCRLSDVEGVNAEVSFSVPGLIFEPTYLGGERPLNVAVENRGRASVDVTLEVEAPFSLPESVIHVAGGSSTPVAVIFRPTVEGPAQASLRLSNIDGVTPVELAATGLPPKSCAPSTCATAVFDAALGACVEAPLADGTTCATHCVANGQCMTGVCKGAVADCDDANACTSDACAAGEGCVHFDASGQCPEPSDKCHVAACDPVKGCLAVEVPDGTSCGDNNCDTARVCLSGQCQSVKVPEGSQCGVVSPCQAAGVCRSQQCEQPGPTPLASAWTYSAPTRYVFDFKGVADAFGNLYWVECGGGTNPSLPIDLCVAVSYTSQGVQRFREPVPMTEGPLLSTQQLLSGNLFVFTLGGAELFAVSASTGQLVWRKGAQAFALAGGPSMGVIDSLAAGNDSQLWVGVTFSQQSRGPKPDSDPGLAALLSVRDLATGSERWRSVVDYYGLGRVILDSANRAYVSYTPHPGARPGGLSLRSFSADGALRWETAGAEVRATFNGRLALDDGEVRSTIDGTLLWPSLERPELPYGIELDPVLSSKGHFEATCTPFLPPDALVPVDYAPWVLTGLRTEPDGALGWSQRVLTVPNDKVYRAYSPVSSLSLSADNRAVQSGSPDESDLRLIGTGKSADESFSCVLPPSFQTVDGATSFLGTSVLLNDAWAVTEHVECHTCEDGSWEHLRVFRAPRLRPAAHGWTGQNGNSTRDNREH